MKFLKKLIMKIINNNIEIKHTSDAKELAYKIYYEMIDLSNNE